MFAVESFNFLGFVRDVRGFNFPGFFHCAVLLAVP